MSPLGFKARVGIFELGRGICGTQKTGELSCPLTVCDHFLFLVLGEKENREEKKIIIQFSKK